MKMQSIMSLLIFNIKTSVYTEVFDLVDYVPKPLFIFEYLILRRTTMKFVIATILSLYFATVVGWNPFIATTIMFGAVYFYNKLTEEV